MTYNELRAEREFISYKYKEKANGVTCTISISYSSIH